MTQPADSSRTPATVAKAIALVILAIVLFDTMAVFVRLLLPRYTPQELSAYRNVLGVIPSLGLLIATRELRFRKGALLIRQWPLALSRGVSVAIAQFAFYSSLGLLELATVSALAQTSAFFVVIFAILLLGERVGAWRWGAVAMGFLGALLILRPGADTFTWPALLPIVAAAGYGLPMVMVRMFEHTVPNALLYLYSAFASGIAAIALVLLTSGFAPIQGLADLGLILIMALCGGCAVLVMMLAYRLAESSVLAPFSFVGLISSFGFGYFVFGEAPIGTLFPGVILIVAAGVLIMWRERRDRS